VSCHNLSIVRTLHFSNSPIYPLALYAEAKQKPYLFIVINILFRPCSTDFCLQASQHRMINSCVTRRSLSPFLRQYRLLSKYNRTGLGVKRFSYKASSVTELVRLRLKDGVYPDIDDPNTATGKYWNKLFQPLLRSNGCQSHHWGRQMEYPDVATIFVGWDSVDHHTKFTETRYSIFISASRKQPR
jgi:hypothetical protein